MLQLKEWKAKKEVQLACGHKLKVGETGYTITLFVCQQEASCLPQAIKACFAAQTKQATAEQPDILYKLWHACFGFPTRMRKPTFLFLLSISLNQL